MIGKYETGAIAHSDKIKKGSKRKKEMSTKYFLDLFIRFEEKETKKKKKCLEKNKKEMETYVPEINSFVI